jgi:hypothetical protein
MATDLTVANTILQQLGGRKFTVMTGARNLAGDANSLRFKYGAGLVGKDGSNMAIIRLNAFDTYDVEFLYARGINSRVCQYREGVYADDLRATFERVTGIATSLGTMGARL